MSLSVLNVDDDKYEALKSLCRARVVTYGVNKECDYRAINIRIDSESTTFDLVYREKIHPVKSSLVAMYNVYNLLACIAALHQDREWIWQLFYKPVPRFLKSREEWNKLTVDISLFM